MPSAARKSRRTPTPRRRGRPVLLSEPIKLTLTVESRHADAIQRLARERGTSSSAVLRDAIEAYVGQ